MKRNERGMITAKKFIATVCIGSLICLTALQPVSAQSPQGGNLDKAIPPVTTIESS